MEEYSNGVGGVKNFFYLCDTAELVFETFRGYRENVSKEGFWAKKRIERRLECVVFSVFLWYLGI